MQRIVSQNRWGGAFGLALLVAGCAGKSAISFGEGDGGAAGAGGRATAGTGSGAQAGENGSSGGAGKAGAAGASGSAGSAGASGSSAGAAGAAGSGGSVCAAITMEVEAVPLDLFIMLDRSGSMIPNMKQPTDRWTPVTGAISAFVNTPVRGHVGVGLGFFPPVARPETCSGDESCGQFGPCDAQLGANGCIGYCKASLYEDPVVAVQPLPGAAAPISSAIAKDNAHPSGGTPMAEGLAGAVAYAKKVQQKHPTHVVTLLLATDGEPSGPPGQGCQETLGAVAEQAAAGFRAGIRTFVIGVGNQAPNLDAVAKAGGTEAALRADDGSDITALFQAKLDEIRGTVACRFQLPAPSEGDEFDYEKAEVSFTPEGGAEEKFGQTASGTAESCGGRLAYHYDDPANPKVIVLCPKACERIKSGEGKVRIALGCE